MTELQLDAVALAPDGPNVNRARVWLAEGARLLAAGEESETAIVYLLERFSRGPGELGAFLRRYAEGTTTYSWRWDRCHVSQAGDVAWLLAVGVETAATAGAEEETAYRFRASCPLSGSARA